MAAILGQKKMEVTPLTMSLEGNHGGMRSPNEPAEGNARVENSVWKPQVVRGSQSIGSHQEKWEKWKKVTEEHSGPSEEQESGTRSTIRQVEDVEQVANRGGVLTAADFTQIAREITFRPSSPSERGAEVPTTVAQSETKKTQSRAYSRHYWRLMTGRTNKTSSIFPEGLYKKEMMATEKRENREKRANLHSHKKSEAETYSFFPLNSDNLPHKIVEKMIPE
ncbi:hypothetical protein NDU88_000675 [Pleurodeles waltl]|uniref:Uncharacterized protein n=1 Tax=Pleurodeles waltl TaxID=8319 RepID=A0AAV7SAQ2_PLEWA|nr:hypothetical protein NDU88_000675 [Pleurodeles waltl]